MLSHFSRPHGAPCIVIETRSLWGEDVCRIWLPDRDETALVARADVCEIDEAPREPVGAAQIAWVAAAARVNAALEDEAQRALLAPLQAGVTPLPHQLDALRRAMSGERVRYMLADEVGLGKTIEAGLILRELKLRGRAARVLVVAPKSLAQQWAAEMRTHFGAWVVASAVLTLSHGVNNDTITDQGQCGSCWAFLSSGGIEDPCEVSTGNLETLSEQQLTDCKDQCQSGSCWAFWSYGVIEDPCEVSTGSLMSLSVSLPWSPRMSACTFQTMYPWATSGTANSQLLAFYQADTSGTANSQLIPAVSTAKPAGPNSDNWVTIAASMTTDQTAYEDTKAAKTNEIKAYLFQHGNFS